MGEYITRAGSGVIRGSKLGIPADIDELLKDKAETETVQKMNTDINKRIDSTNTNVDVISKSLGATQTQVTEHSERLTSLEETIPESQQQLSTLSERTESLEITTQAHTNSINELSVRMDGIVIPETGEGNPETPQPDLSEPLLELTNKVNELEPKVNENVTKIGTVTTDVGTLKTNVSTIQTNVSTIQTKVTGYDKDIPTLKTDSGTLKTDVSTLKTDMGTTKTRLSTLENNDIIGFKMKPYEVRKQNDTWDLRSDYVNAGGSIAVFEDGKRLRLTFAEPFTTRPIGLVSQDYSGVSAQYDVKIGNCQLGYADITFFNKTNAQVDISTIGTPLYLGVMFVGV